MKTTLIHVQADGENDTLHYIWDLRRQPTILVALCAKDTNVSIEWNKVAMDVSVVNFTPNPIYTLSFVLTKVSFCATLFYRRVYCMVCVHKLTCHMLNSC